MQQSPISLDKSLPGHAPKKFNCPVCQKKRFVKYWDSSKSEYLEDRFGRCDREEHCGYFLSPFAELKDENAQARPYTAPPPSKIEPVIVPKDVLKRSLAAYHSNTLVQFLIEKFGEYKAMALVYQFYIGTAKDGSTIFWQIDQFLRPRTASKISYGANGKRIKELEPKRLFTIDKGYRACLFGEHQLFTEAADCLIGIVESEKTAIFCCLFMPYLGMRKIIWMASSGVNGLTEEKIQCLRGRDIMLVPDLSFHARATWGQVPMRKKVITDEQGRTFKRISIDGEIVEDYVSAKDKLKAIGCSVRFFDPSPDTWDATDIGDIFIELPVPIDYEMPDFSKFDLSLEIKSDLKRLDEAKPEPQAFTFNTERSFEIDDLNAEILTVTMTPIGLKDKVENMLNNPGVRNLIKKFDLCNEGRVGPVE